MSRCFACTCVTAALVFVFVVVFTIPWSDMTKDDDPDHKPPRPLWFFLSVITIPACVLVMYVRIQNTWNVFWLHVFALLAAFSLGQTPALIFIASLLAVLWQHHVRLIIWPVALVPALMLGFARHLVPTNHILWTFLSVCCALHSALGAGWTEETPAKYYDIFRKRGVSSAIPIWIAIFAGGWFLAAALASIITLIAIWQALHIRGALHRLGATFEE